MDRDTIYLDNDEEITSVVDKLKAADFGAVDLVIPKEALILQSVVNLKLLKKQAENLGKEITIVTQDKVGKKLASQIGIPVVDRPGETPKEVHVTEAEPMAQAPEEGIKIKGTPDEEKATNDEEDGIEMKDEASPIVPTSEVVGADATEGIKEESGVANLGKAMPDETSKKKKKFRKLKIWLLAGGFVLLALTVVAYIYLPMANITIKLAAEKKKVDFTFTADKSLNSVDSTTQKVPGQEISAELEKTGEYATTGKKKTGTKATGTVKIYNNFSTAAKALDAGDKVVASNGLIFTINTNVSVPGYTDPGGGKVAGTAEVGVTANAVGEEYNAPNNAAFSIPRYGSADFYATATAAFSGGTSKDIQFVTQADINAAKEDLAKQLEQELISEAIKKSERDQRIVDKAYKVTEISAAATPDLNGEAAKFSLKMKASIKAIAFQEEDLSKLAEAVLGDEIGSGKEIVEKGSLTQAAEFVEGDFDKGTIKVKVTGEAWIAVNLDEEKIKTDLTGVPNGEATSEITGIEGVTNAAIARQFPRFLKRMPRIRSHIYLKEEIEKSE